MYSYQTCRYFKKIFLVHLAESGHEEIESKPQGEDDNAVILPVTTEVTLDTSQHEDGDQQVAKNVT